MTDLIMCKPMDLPRERWSQAVRAATAINPVNRAPIERLTALNPMFKPQPADIAAVTSKYWHGGGGVQLTVGFLDNPPADLRARILSHMNAWNRMANIGFAESAVDPQVRINRGSGGYWSYIGTDITLVGPNEPTMNLQDFTMSTPDSEFY